MACEKPVFDNTGAEDTEAGANVVLRFVYYEMEPMASYALQGEHSRAATDITQICSRLNIAVFTDDGTKVKTLAQKQGDSDYGTVRLALNDGTYKLVVIAHNGEGSATITSEEKVTFPNNKVTDTFYYYGSLDVTTETKTYSLVLTRAVALLRMVITDQTLPAAVTKFKFYYVGGSSTFSPSAGFGIVQSKQTEIRDVANDGNYDLFTMPHTEEDVITKLTVTALDANDNAIAERTIENIPIRRNYITRYTGNFFGNSGADADSGDMNMTAEPEWAGISDNSF